MVNSFLRRILDRLWTDSFSVKKRSGNPKPPVDTAYEENASAPAAPGISGQILRGESVHFAARLEQVIGDEPVAAFARRCGVSEGTVRNCLRGALPRTDNLVSFSEAGGVTVDWLATGRPPKTRAELQRLTEASPRRASTRPTPDPDQSLLVKCMIAAEQALGRDAGIEARAALAAQLLEVIPNLDDRTTGNLQMMLIAEDLTPIAQFLLLVERLDNQLFGETDDD